MLAGRGTSSKQHWADNMNYTQMPIDLPSLGIPDLDQVDGLGPRTKDIYADLRQSDEDSRSCFTTLAKEVACEDEDAGEREIDITFDFPESQLGDGFRAQSLFSNGSHSSDGSEDSWFSKGPYDDEDGDEGEDGDEAGSERRGSTPRVTSGVARTMSGLLNTAEKTIRTTGGILQTAVKKTPLLNTRYDTFVHTGFWDAYLTVRDFIHTTLRQELAQRPAHVMCTGHSLGGALATIACLDITLHTIPRVNEHLFRMREARRKSAMTAPELAAEEEKLTEQAKGQETASFKHKYIKTTVYSFGSPRIGQ